MGHLSGKANHPDCQKNKTLGVVLPVLISSIGEFKNEDVVDMVLLKDLNTKSNGEEHVCNGCCKVVNVNVISQVLEPVDCGLVAVYKEQNVN